MSLVEEARAVRERIAARLRELEPLVREYNELRQAAAEMGIETPGAPSVTATPRFSPGEGGMGPQRAEGAQGTGVPARDEPVAPAAQEAAAPAAEEVAAPEAAARESGGEIGARVLDAVRAQPGMTVAAYARVLNLPPASLYRPVRELTNRGAIVKRARQLFPA